MNKHCPTCECNDSSSLPLFDLRIRVLLDELIGGELRPSEAVLLKLPQHAPRYCFGFTGLKGSISSTKVAGQFLVSLLVPGGVDTTPDLMRTLDSAGNTISVDEIPTTPRQLWRFAYVNTLDPYRVLLGLDTPRANEYSRGSDFDISDSMTLEELMSWAPSVGDQSLRAYLGAHLRPLVAWAEQTAAEIDAVIVSA